MLKENEKENSNDDLLIFTNEGGPTLESITRSKETEEMYKFIFLSKSIKNAEK